MSELRKDPVVERWVIIDSAMVRTPAPLPPDDADELVCPLCPGSEHLCPPDIEVQGGARVIPNHFPLLTIEQDLKRGACGIYDQISGVGANEIIIETPRHGLRQSQLETRELEDLFRAYRERVIDLLRDERLRYVLVYRNQGRIAGANLAGHAHSALLALPIVPRGIQEELSGAKRHFELKERCVYCDILEQEARDGQRLICETEQFMALAPFAARLPFETWIVPKCHNSRFIATTAAELADLALIFKNVMTALDAALDKPPYNYAIHAAPRGAEADEYYHWHIEIIPRLTSLSGFELGGEMFINVTPPEEAAAFLKTCLRRKGLA